ncbi:MAG: hypothetical protein D6679_10265 [Candidatus Hydrogenedentota bacterium]|nr:MAG: hypothetical protein D6679_10265 [Candidatus Hydrogenedentota bacterium]
MKSTHRGITAVGGWTEITPPKPCPLFGYNDRPEPYEIILDPLEANAVLVESDAARIFLVSLDTLYPSREFLESLRARLSPRILLEPDEILLAASHTHGAPALDPRKPGIGVFSEEYFSFAVEAVAKLLSDIDRCERVSVVPRYSETEADLGINRRKVVSSPRNGRKRCLLAPNPEGVVDRRIPFVGFYGPDGRPVALLWSAACHPVTATNRRAVTADYPGWGRKRLRKSAGFGIPVLFLQGFSGDVRPNAVSADGMAFAPFTPEGRRGWFERLGTALERGFRELERHGRDGGRRSAGDAFALRTESMPLRDFLTGPDADAALRVRRIDCGPVTIFGIGAEPVASYSELLLETFRKESGGDRFLLPAGCIDDVFGYLPRNTDLENGGYEAGEFFEVFGVNARFRKNVEEAIVPFIQQTCASHS